MYTFEDLVQSRIRRVGRKYPVECLFKLYLLILAWVVFVNFQLSIEPLAKVFFI